MGRCANFGAASRRARLRLPWLRGSLTGYARGKVRLGEVPDDRLVGTWSDESLYMGSMEIASITFRPDGTGWTYWSRDGGSFYVHRFDWRCGARGRVLIKLRRSLSGTYAVRGPGVRHRVARDHAEDTIWNVRYAVRDGRDLLGNPVSLLEFD